MPGPGTGRGRLEGRRVIATRLLIYNDPVNRTTNKADTKNGHRPKTKVSKLGRELRRISDKFLASGGKPLSRTQIEREVTERRGGR